MKSVVELDIDAPQATVAALFTDPKLAPQWMDDVVRYEAISGEPGTPGSKYRLVPKKGSMVFVATVISRTPPGETCLELEASNVSVSVKGTFAALAAGRSRLTSEEVFRFRGLFHQAFGLLAAPAIRKVHRRHMEAFKRFAESRSQSQPANP